MLTHRFFEDGVCEDAKRIREEVFVKEQGFHNEFDEIDDRAVHLVLYMDGEPAATARMFFDGESRDVLTLGRVSVLPQYRKQHLGNALLERMEKKAQEMGVHRIALSAQCRVQPFYEKNGYTAMGEVYLDEYCPHIHMEKELGE